MKVDILYEDDHLFVVVKPPGMPSQGERSSAMDMVSYLKNLLACRDHVKNPYVAVVHRLDRPVGGIMVYAKTPAAAAGLSAQVSQRIIGKEYTAVLSGVLPKKAGRLEDMLVKDGRTNISRVILPKAGEKLPADAKKAVLDYEVLETKAVDRQMLTRVRIRLETGRHHQIRVQMAHAGAPVAGDMKYGSGIGVKIRNIGLFSTVLEFDHPVTGRKMRFEAEPQGEAFML